MVFVEVTSTTIIIEDIVCVREGILNMCICANFINLFAKFINVAEMQLKHDTMWVCMNISVTGN